MGLAEFLDKAGRTPFVWGRFDCCLWLAEWGRSVTGVDGGEPWRGRYRTALGCERLVRREGGVASIVARSAALAGMKPQQQPTKGCVGVLQVPAARGVREVGAIFTGRRWATLKAGGGILFITATPVACWGL